MSLKVEDFDVPTWYPLPGDILTDTRLTDRSVLIIRKRDYLETFTDRWDVLVAGDSAGLRVVSISEIFLLQNMRLCNRRR